MAWIKRFVVVAVLAALGVLGWSWFAGGLKMKRDIAAFAANMETCTPMEQNTRDPMSGATGRRAIKGPDGDTCGVDFSTLGPQILVCQFPLFDMPDLATSFAGQADFIGLFGVTRIQIDTNSEDALYLALNSEACSVTDG